MACPMTLAAWHRFAIAVLGILAISDRAGIAGGPALELPKLLPEAEELQAALEAAPPHLRDGAGVYLLRSTGYARVRETRNGFTCIVEHGLPTSFEPACFDAEGAASVLPVILYRAELRSKGRSLPEIDRAVADGYLSGRFRAPRRVGICYMLSTRNMVVLDRNSRRVGPAPPHLMFYAPYLTNADFGTTEDLAGGFVIADEGAPTALIIVPVRPGPNVHSHR
jgi:hypothetical protein